MSYPVNEQDQHQTVHLDTSNCNDCALKYVNISAGSLRSYRNTSSQILIDYSTLEPGNSEVKVVSWN